MKPFLWIIPAITAAGALLSAPPSAGPATTAPATTSTPAAASAHGASAASGDVAGAATGHVPNATAATTPTDVTGTVAIWRPDRGTILAQGAAAPVEFGFATKVDYVDYAGKPVTHTVIQPGDPITIRYLRAGDRLLVSRVTMERKPTPVATPGSEGAPTTAQTAGPKATLKADASNEAKAIEQLRSSIEKESRQLGGARH